MAENIDKKTNPSGQSRVLVPEEFFVYTGAAATNADFKDHKVTYMASNNIKSIGVKVSPLLFAEVSVSAILLVYSIGIVIGDTFCKYR